MILCSAYKCGHGQVFCSESYQVIITVTSLLTDFYYDGCLGHIWAEKTEYKSYDFGVFLIAYTEKKHQGFTSVTGTYPLGNT